MNIASILVSDLSTVTGGCAGTPAARIQAAKDSIDFGVGSSQQKQAFACLHPAERRALARQQPTGGDPFDPDHR